MEFFRGLSPKGATAGFEVVVQMSIARKGDFLTKPSAAPECAVLPTAMSMKRKFS